MLPIYYETFDLYKSKHLVLLLIPAFQPETLGPVHDRVLDLRLEPTAIIMHGDYVMSGRITYDLF